YSLGATVYAMLMGRSPFEATTGSKPHEVLQRALSNPPPSIDREEVPRSLDHLLRLAMDKSPANRPQSAAAFARALGEIERELRLAATPFEVRDTGALTSLVSRSQAGEEE